MLLGRFSNLRGLIVIDCLFLFLSSFLKLQSPGGLKPCLKTSLRRVLVKEDIPSFLVWISSYVVEVWWLWKADRQCVITEHRDWSRHQNRAGAPVAFKTWWGHQYMVGIICPPAVEIGFRWLPKLGVDTSPRPHAHRHACCVYLQCGADSKPEAVMSLVDKSANVLNFISSYACTLVLWKELKLSQL